MSEDQNEPTKYNVTLVCESWGTRAEVRDTIYERLSHAGLMPNAIRVEVRSSDISSEPLHSALVRWIDRCVDPAPGRNTPTVDWIVRGVEELIELHPGIIAVKSEPVVDGHTPIDTASADYRAGESDGYERGWQAGADYAGRPVGPSTETTIRVVLELVREYVPKGLRYSDVDDMAEYFGLDS